MARKHSPDRKPYSPVDEKLTRSLPTVISTVSSEAEDVESVTPSPVIMRAERPSSVDSEEQGKLRSSNSERLNKQIRFQVSDAERREIRRIVSRLSGELETSVDMSHVARALFLIFRHAEPEIMQHARRSESLTRPDNNNAFALAEFEHDIAQLLLKAFRDTNSIRST